MSWLRARGALAPARSASLWLAASSLYFCHRLFAHHWNIEGDALHHMYFRINEELVRKIHNPHQWDYLDVLSFSGINNPLLQAIRLGVHLLFWGGDPVLQALMTNAIASACFLWLLQLSLYWFLRSSGCARFGALLGAIMASLTGFHLVGVRQFDHMYLLSYAAVGPLLVFASRNAWQRGSPLRDGLVLAGATGLSLLGGSNSPLFFFVPGAFALPFFGRELPSPRTLVRYWAWLVASLAGGVVCAAASMVPAVVHVGETERARLSMTMDISSAGPFPILLTAIFRDWWRTAGVHFHESDFFVGILALMLALLGLTTLRQKARMPRFMAFLLLYGLVVCQQTNLPDLVSGPLGSFFASLSIRHPNRAFVIVQFALAYFAARGLYRAPIRLASMVVAAVAGLAVYLSPTLRASLPLLIPDVTLSAWASTALFLAAAILLLVGRKLSWGRRARAGVTALAYFGFAFAPTPATMYPIHFRESAELRATLPSDRLSASAQLGLASRYADTAARARPIFFDPKGPALRLPQTLEGRVLHPDDLAGFRHNHFAPRTGHRFAFTASNDPASLIRLNQLAAGLSESILDLAGVCWILANDAKEPGTQLLKRRPSCWPELRWVERVEPIRSDHAHLERLRTASTQELSRALPVSCESASCRSDDPPASGDPARDIQIDSSEPGRLRARLVPGPPGYVFASIPYRQEWKAFVNDLPVPIMRAAFAYMALPVGDGPSRIELRFDDTLHVASRVVSLLAFLCVGIGVWRIRTRSCTRSRS